MKKLSDKKKVTRTLEEIKNSLIAIEASDNPDFNKLDKELEEYNKKLELYVNDHDYENDIAA